MMYTFAEAARKSGMRSWRTFALWARRTPGVTIVTPPFDRKRRLISEEDRVRVLAFRTEALHRDPLAPPVEETVAELRREVAELRRQLTQVRVEGPDNLAPRLSATAGYLVDDASRAGAPSALRAPTRPVQSHTGPMRAPRATRPLAADELALVTALPAGAVALSAFAERHAIPRSTVTHAQVSGRLSVARGDLVDYPVVIAGASRRWWLTATGQAHFVAIWSGRVRRCDDCPHTPPAPPAPPAPPDADADAE